MNKIVDEIIGELNPDDYDDEAVELIPVDDFRKLTLPPSADQLNVDAVVLFAVVLKETESWPGTPVEVWMDGQVIVSGFTKAVAALFAGVDAVPCIRRDFDNFDDATAYSAQETPRIWRRHPGGGREIGKINWMPLATGRSSGEDGGTAT